MCAIVGGGEVMLMGRGRGVCSEPWRWCAVYLRLRNGLVPTLHLGESGGEKVEYESILMYVSEYVCGCVLYRDNRMLCGE